MRARGPREMRLLVKFSEEDTIRTHCVPLAGSYKTTRQGAVRLFNTRQRIPHFPRAGRLLHLFPADAVDAAHDVPNKLHRQYLSKFTVVGDGECPGDLHRTTNNAYRYSCLCSVPSQNHMGRITHLKTEGFCTQDADGLDLVGVVAILREGVGIFTCHQSTSPTSPRPSLSPQMG